MRCRVIRARQKCGADNCRNKTVRKMELERGPPAALWARTGLIWTTYIYGGHHEGVNALVSVVTVGAGFDVDRVDKKE
jgi:hypothetical protein